MTIKGYKFRKIIKNRDSKGYILTYSAEDEYGSFHEVNTIREAKIIAAIDPFDNLKAQERHEDLMRKSKELLRRLTKI